MGIAGLTHSVDLHVLSFDGTTVLVYIRRSQPLQPVTPKIKVQEPGTPTGPEGVMLRQEYTAFLKM